MTRPSHPVSLAVAVSSDLPSVGAPCYQAPRVTDLGRWQAVTLIYSVPIGPGGLGKTSQPPRF